MRKQFEKEKIARGNGLSQKILTDAPILARMDGGDKEAHMLTKEQLERMLLLPKEIDAAQEAVIQAQARLTSAKEMLQQKEDDLLLGNRVDGKNAEIRAAHMRTFTTHEREALVDAEFNLKTAAARFDSKRNELISLTAVAYASRVAV
ncbi:hypothetical protein PV433_10280 [Paenibacillus sp. GYB004]|uniref:hypothetical protein n=1 Tax=Paenibacillus sp. GYB004 TaxID=2994393 RepID=UPI002F96D113